MPLLSQTSSRKENWDGNNSERKIELSVICDPLLQASKLSVASWSCQVVAMTVCFNLNLFIYLPTHVVIA